MSKQIRFCSLARTATGKQDLRSSIIIHEQDSKPRYYLSMLKKIAHNSTIPALGGNHALQNLIAAEKAVLISLQKLSVDYSKASEALRTWGLTEGDYLGGILSASTAILNHFSSALSQYAAHGHSMRDQLKAIRTKEESLDDIERRRRSIIRKAEDAEKKLSKMTSESKYFTLQTDTLNRLRDEIQILDSDIMLEEAALNKFKRSATKVWMGLKFGGLVECCQKGSIAGEFGRLAIAEITEEMTQPGSPRSFTYPHNKIEDCVAEAYRGVNMVTLSTFPSAELRDRGQYDPTPPDAPLAAFYISAPTQPPRTSTTNDDNAGYQANRPVGDGNSYSPQNPSFFPTSPQPQQLGVNEGDVDNFGANVRPTGPQYQQQSSQRPVNSYQQQFRSDSPHPPRFSQVTVNPLFSHTSPLSQQFRVNEGAMDDLGANVLYTNPPNQQRVSQGSNNSSFSQTLPSSRQLGANEGAVDDFGVNTHSTGPPYQQRFSQQTYNSSFSQTFPSLQQIRANEGTLDNFGPTVPPYEQRFSQGSSSSQTLSPSQQLRVNEGAVDDIGPSVHSPRPQRFIQGIVNSSFSQALPPSQQIGINEGAVGPNVPSTGSPHPQQFTQGAASSSFSQTLPPSQQIRTNEGAVGPDVPSTGSPHPQQFSQGAASSSSSQTLPPSQQIRTNEVTVGPNVPSTGSPHPQQFSQGAASSSFSQTLPPSQQIRTNEGAVGTNVPSTGSPHPQQFSQGAASSSFSLALPPSQQIRVNEGTVDDFGPNVRPTTHTQHIVVQPLFSQTLPRSQQLRVNEGAVDDISPSVHLPHPQQSSQGIVKSSLSQTLPPSQQPRVNEGAVGPNLGSTGSPHPQQFSQGAASSSFSRTSPPSQQIRVNEGTVDDSGPNVRPTINTQQITIQPLFSQTLPPSEQLRVKEDDSGANVRSTGSPRSQQFSQGTVDPSFSQTLSPYEQLRVNEGAVDNIGSNVRSTGPAESSSTTGGRIAAFQVQSRPAGSTGGYSLYDPLSSGRLSKAGPSFSESVANALHEKFDPKSETKMSPWSSNQFNDNLESPIISEGTTRRFFTQPANAGGGRSDSPIPVTAPPELDNIWTNSLLEDPSRASIYSSLSSQSSVYYDALVTPVREDSGNGGTPPETAVPFSVPPATTMTTPTALSAQNTNEEDSRHVRFGGVEDVDREIEKRISLEKVQRAIGPRENRRNSEANRTEIIRDLPQQANPSVNLNNPIKYVSRRIPPPNITPLEEGEKDLNAAATREISSELEGLKNNNLNQLPSQVDQHSQPPTPTLGPYSHYSAPPYIQAAYQDTSNLPTEQQPLDVRKSLPPRLQALNNNKPGDSQVPPRFQNSSSSTPNPLPPRFQTSQVSAPGGLNQ